MSRSDFKLDSIFPKLPIKTKMNKMSPEKGFFNTFLANFIYDTFKTSKKINANKYIKQYKF